MFNDHIFFKKIRWSFSNIFLHGSIYGYNTNLATPSVASGTVSFDYTIMSNAPSNVTRQEVVFGLRQPMTQINVSDVVFSTSSVYTFIKEGNAYRTVISNNDGTVQTIPSNSPILEVPLVNFKQEKPEIIEFTLPNYNFGSYYNYSFEVEDEYISGIQVLVQMPEAEGYTEYSVEKVKYLIDPSAKTVFFNQTSSDSYVIEFGSGVHGAWIPGANVRILLTKTLGVTANFSQEVKSEILAPTQIFLYNKLVDGTVQSSTLDPSQYLKINFKYSEGGIDPLSGEALRKALVRFIQTRDNFLSEEDFYNIIEKYTTDFRLLFKKMKVQENVFYLQRALRDSYQVPIRSLNLMPEIFTKEQHVDGIRYYTRDDGKLTLGMYFYRIFAVDRFNNIVQSDEIKATLTSENDTGSIHLSWDPIPGALKYQIYGRTAEFERMWEVTEPMFSDMGSDEESEPTENGLPEVEEYPYILFPEFEQSKNKFVSPFLYKFNPIYNYYEGWLFYPELLINFASLEQTAQGEVTAASLPSIFLNIVYDQKNKKSIISLKSYQSINEWHFSLTAPEINIQSADMVMEDESTFSYDYQSDHGFILNPTQFTITGSTQGVDVFVAKTAQINQRYDITDLLQIPVFIYQDVRYLVDVPVLSSDAFYENKVLYLDKILQFLLGFNFEENRLISDNLEFRFLNTDSIRSYLLSNCLVQGKDLYKNMTFLENMNPISIADSPDKIPMNGETWIIGGSPVKIETTEIDGEALKIYQESGYGGLKDAQDYMTISPYSIVLYGDYRTKIAPLDIIRVKGAVTEGINGEYHVLNVFFENQRTIVYTVEKINQSLNEGTLYYATYESWRKGGPDNFAQWKRDLNGWLFTSIKCGDVVTVQEPILSTYTYSKKSEYQNK